MTVPEPEAITVDVLDGVAWIKFNRPEKLNAFTSPAYAQLRDEIRLADLNPEVDVAVLTGEGRAFATGGDLSELLDRSSDGDRLALVRFADSNPMAAIRDAKLVTIAAVNGLCVAGGLVIAALCDFILAADDAVFSLPEARLGIAEAISVTSVLPSVGARHLKYMALTGRRLSADDAYRVGLVNEVVPRDELRTQVEKLIVDIRKTDREARTMYKKIINDLCPPINHFLHYSASFNIEHLAKFAGERRA